MRPLLSTAFPQQRAQRPDDRGIGELSLGELQALTDQDRHPPRACTSTQLGNQPTLAHTGFAREQCKGPLARPGSFEQRLEHRELLLAADELRARDRAGHQAIIRNRSLSLPCPDGDGAGDAMRMRGLEPPPDFSDTDLNRARLPIPPHPRGEQRRYRTGPTAVGSRRASFTAGSRSRALLASDRSHNLPLSSRGLGRRPLMAETRVRIPVAVLGSLRVDGDRREGHAVVTDAQGVPRSKLAVVTPRGATGRVSP